MQATHFPPPVLLCALALLAACSKLAEAPNPSAAPAAPAAASLASGIDIGYIDPAVRAQDDFFRHINGKWLATVEIPPDKGEYGSFTKLYDDSQEKLKSLIEGLGEAPADADAQRIGALYASFLDEARLEKLGVEPLASGFARIDAVKDKQEIPGLIAHFNQLDIGAPMSPQVHQDARNPAVYVADLVQGGLGLPDRDYYLKDD